MTTSSRSRIIATDNERRRWACELIASDQAYFIAGSTAEKFSDWIICAHPLRPRSIVFLDAAAARAIAGQIPKLGDYNHTSSRSARQQVRLYTATDSEDVAHSLEQLGLRRRIEHLFLGIPHDCRSLGIRLEAVETEAAWKIKQEFHDEVMERPDGHPCAGDVWTRFERSKVDAGVLKAYLIWVDTTLVGSVGIMSRNAYLRVKNLVIHPTWRKRGVAQEVLARISAGPADRPNTNIGMLAVASSPGERLYRTAGLSSIGEYFEWSNS